jgi:threonine aldolase
MIRFTNDYSEGCHPSILEAMAKANLEGNFGYSLDDHSEHAHALIRAAIGRPDADVHILVGGTQTNQTAIAAFLRPYEAVIAADTGHVCVHETGAIEATGHKCIPCPNRDGKLTPDAVRAAFSANTSEHMVKPALVYVSETTELGTLYSYEELKALRAVCDELGLLLYVDGARLGCVLAAGAVTLPQLAGLADAFYIGGTKNGALFGEALVILNDALKPCFRYSIKQRGGMLAKGWMLGVQFEVLMQNDLYVSLARHANEQALRLREGIAALGYSFASESLTNQQFPILPDSIVAALAPAFSFEYSSKPDASHTAIRLVTSWATKPESVDAFLQALAGLHA